MAIALNAEIKTRPYIFIGKSALVIAVIVASFLSLASQAEATGSVTLHWDQNVEPDIAGYRLLYGITSGSYSEQIDVGNTTTATVPGLADGGTYFFVVTAYNTVMMESPPSNEVSATVGIAPPPTPTPTPTPTPSPIPTPTPPAPGAAFVKGINVNGTAATINGNSWISYASALATGFSTANPIFSTNITFTPAVDSDTNRMLNTGIWGQASDVNFSQTLSNGSYFVYLWTVENYVSNYRSFNVKLEGTQVASAIGSLPNNTWQRYGPYSVTVSDGSLNVNLVRVTGDPTIQGLEIWSGAYATPKIFWQNKSTGERVVWIMNGTTFSRSVSLGTLATSWNIVGVGDFNGDGKADILWQHSSGARSIWLMNGTVRTGSVSLGNVDNKWSIAGSGDFNGDGKADILWQNTSGARGIWLMNGTVHISSVSLGNVDKQWKIVGSDDFNGDGKTDILWQHSSGARSIWLMNGTVRTSSVSLGNVDNTWNIAGTGDFNGDGKADILWQYSSGAGARAIWLMNGTVHTSSVSLGNVSTSWDIRNY